MAFEQRVVEGKLEEISKVGNVKFSGAIHPRTATYFIIHANKGDKRELPFRGVILPDSIGHPIVLHIGREDDPDIITNIYDKTLGRKYSI